MPPGRQGAMFPDHHHFPETVLDVLPKQCGNRGSRRIGRLDSRRLPDSSTRSAQTEVELVVLISHQLGVKQTDSVEHRPIPATEVYGINLPFVVWIVSFASTGTERGAKRRGDGLSHQAPAFGN